MITMLNRKELITTYDVEKYANARDDLKDAGIEFKIRTRRSNFKSVFAGKAGSLGRGLNHKGRYGIEYILYVKDEDYNRAVHIIHNKEGWR